MTIEGRTAIVTGGAHGIGAALARRLHREGAAGIALLDHDPDAAARTARDLGARAFACDVADLASVQDAVARATDALGPIDLLFSNAGILEVDPDPANPSFATDGAWQRAFAVNVMGHVHLARALLPAMLARGAGTIVNTVSAAGMLAEMSSASYTASKHAALAFTESLAIAHRRQGIDIRALCPMGVATRMTASASGDEPAFVDGILQPDQVADATITALASDGFLILPHPKVAEYIRLKADNRDRWLAGMAKLAGRAPPSRPAPP